MRRTLLAVLVMVAFCGCSESGGVHWGEPELRVLSGNDQVHVVAEDDSLEAPVTAQLYREPRSGGITLRIGPAPLHAQTQVQGVAGEQVCAVPVGANGLAPWSPCDITGSDGKALFWFEPGTRAGESCAEIRATVNGQRVVTDMACATVYAGPPVMVRMHVDGQPPRAAAAGDTIDLRTLIWHAEDAFGNELSPDDLLTAPDSIVTSAWFERGASVLDYSPITTGWVAVVPDSTGYRIHEDGSYQLSIQVWLRDMAPHHAIFASTAFAVTP